MRKNRKGGREEEEKPRKIIVAFRLKFMGGGT